MSNQITKSWRDFVGRLWGTIGQGDVDLPALPVIPLTIRIGIAGHLQLAVDARLDEAVCTIFAALRQYAAAANSRYHKVLFGHVDALASPERLRVIGQLASGFDQKAASMARAAGYDLQVVLPADRETARRDVEANAGADAEVKHAAGVEFCRLLDKTERVLELDPSRPGSLCTADYAQAASVIIAHSDLLLIAVYSDAPANLGGTAWIEQKAKERNLPIVRLSLEDIARSTISWVGKGRRMSRRLFDPNDARVLPEIFAPALDGALTGSACGPPRAGRFERGYGSQLDKSMNAAYWSERWDDGAGTPIQSLAKAREDIDRDFGLPKIWADHRASMFAEMMRGAFLVSAALGLLAICAAASGIVLHTFGLGAKTLELVCLLLIAKFAYRSRRFEWRSQWTSLRQMERLIDQAAWLNLLGRTRPQVMVEPGTAADDVSSWADAYLRAIMRSAAIPNARFSENYLLAVHELVLKNLVQTQRDYYESEWSFQKRAGDVLERWMAVLIAVAAGAVAAYILLHVILFAGCLQPPGPGICAGLELAADYAHPWVGWLGVLAPAVVATLAAIASFGEYQQLASRYEGIRDALETVEGFLLRHLADASSEVGAQALSSMVLAHEIEEATEVLLQEVSGWRALLQVKRIEVT